MPAIIVTSEAHYSPSDEVFSLAGVGESVTFEMTATNRGNVDIDDTAASNEIYNKDEGEYLDTYAHELYHTVDVRQINNNLDTRPEEHGV